MELSTNFSLPLSLQHLLWTTGAAFCCGVVLSRLMLKLPGLGRKKLFIKRNGFSHLFWLNLALLFLLADLLLTSGQGLPPFIWAWTGGLSLFFCFILRFPRTLGLPLMVFLLVTGAMFFWTLRHFRFYSQNQTIVDVRIWKHNPNTSQREFHVYFPLTTLEFPSRHFYREVSPSSWIPSELLTFHSPVNSLIEGTHLFSLKRKDELDVVAWILWEFTGMLGWSKVIQLEPPHPLAEFYIYRLKTGPEKPFPEFHWVVFKPKMELE